MNFDELFGMNVIRDYLKDRAYKPFLGEMLFPEDKIEDIDLAYIKGANNLPVSASVHSFDSETQIDSRDKMDYVKQRLALIKRKSKMGEELLIKLNTPRTDKEFQKAKEMAFNDVDKMVKAVKTRIEAMRMELLSTGKIKVNENGVVTELDYGVKNENIKTLSGTSLWSDNSSDPLEDITSWVENLVLNSGTHPTRVLTSTKVLSTILRHPKVRKNIFGSESKMISKNALNEFLTANDLPKIATYDDRYRVQNTNGSYVTKRFFPEDKFVMFGSEALGETIYGLTPEEVELSGKSGSEISESEKVTVQIYRSQDPVATWTKAVATALPTFPTAGEILIAKTI